MTWATGEVDGWWQEVEGRPVPGAGRPSPPSSRLAVSLAQGVDLLICRDIAHHRMMRIADVARATRRPLRGEIHAAQAMRGLARCVRGAVWRKLLWRELRGGSYAVNGLRCKPHGANYAVQPTWRQQCHGRPRGARRAKPLRARPAHGAPARRLRKGQSRIPVFHFLDFEGFER